MLVFLGMDKIYAASSSKKVKNLEGDLAKELKELKNEIEDSNFLSRPNANGGKSFRFVFCSDVKSVTK